MNSYAMYTSTADVPLYTLNGNVMSLNDAESRLSAQMRELHQEQEYIRHSRAVALHRMRAQRLASVMAGAMAYDDTTEEEELEEEFDEEALNHQIRYLWLNRRSAEHLNREMAARARRLSHGPQSSREYQREILVRGMLDPTPSTYTSIPFPIPVVTAHHVHQGPHHRPPPGAATPPQFRHYSIPEMHPQHAPGTMHNGLMESPIIDELPPSIEPPAPTPPQYFPEPQPNPNKRGSRRPSFRRDSMVPTPTPPHDTPHPLDAAARVAETHRKYADLRAELNKELSSIPRTIDIDAPPTQNERVLLQAHMLRLEEVLLRADAIAIPLDVPREDVSSLRGARGDLVSSINVTLAGIEQYLQPGTPSGSAGSVTATTATDLEELIEDHEDDAVFNEEIQRVIQATLGRKKDEDLVAPTPRRSVTIEDVPDHQY